MNRTSSQGTGRDESRAGRASSRRGGFTLIELLVVLGIVAVLAALLWPALARARARAEGIGCVNHLRQFSAAWLMYTDDHADGLPPNQGMAGRSFPAPATWVGGWLDNDSEVNWADNTNTWLLTDSLLGPYLSGSVGVWHCPGDRSTARYGGGRLPRVRSYSMNNYLNTPDRGGTDSWRIFRRLSDLDDPGPAMTFVFMDEREDSIQDSVYVVDMYHLAALVACLPRSAHAGAGSLSFADGHAELRKWRDWRTRPPIQKRGHIGLLPEWTGWPVNPDGLWLRARTTSRMRPRREPPRIRSARFARARGSRHPVTARPAGSTRAGPSPRGSVPAPPSPG